MRSGSMFYGGIFTMKKIVSLVLALILLLSVSAFAASTYKIEFAFDEKCTDDIEQLNALLSNLKLKSLELEENSTYISTTRDGSGNILGQQLGFTSGTFICELGDDETGNFYQIETQVSDKNVDPDAYIQNWIDSHTDVIIRIVLQVEYENNFGYVFIYMFPNK